MIEVKSTGGQREQKKAEKLRRIKDAAYACFITNGYDETTTAEIAHKAGIGSATLFFYVDDKRDLLFLIFNEWLASVLKKIEKADFSQINAVDALIMLFRFMYIDYRRSPKLARTALRELNFFYNGKHRDVFNENNRHIRNMIERIIRTAIDRGEVRSDINVELSVSIIFAIFQAEIRRFMAAKIERLDSALARLSSLLTLIVNGVGCKPISR